MATSGKVVSDLNLLWNNNISNPYKQILRQLEPRRSKNWPDIAAKVLLYIKNANQFIERVKDNRHYLSDSYIKQTVRELREDIRAFTNRLARYSDWQCYAFEFQHAARNLNESLEQLEKGPVFAVDDDYDEEFESRLSGHDPVSYDQEYDREYDREWESRTPASSVATGFGFFDELSAPSFVVPSAPSFNSRYVERDVESYRGPVSELFPGIADVFNSEPQGLIWS